MAMKIYKWRGNTYQIDDKDLHHYPGAELVEPKKATVEKKKAKSPANKARKTSTKGA